MPTVSPEALHISEATLPLAGGADGAVVKVHLLLCAEMSGPEGWFNGPPGLGSLPRALGIGVPREQRLRVPIVAFAIEHPGAGVVLVDTGLHASVAEPSGRRRNLGALGALMARDVVLSPAGTAAAQLRALGVDPGQVATVVMTHLHFDHASALCDFPAAEVVLCDHELAAALARGAGAKGYVRAQLDARCRYATLSFDGPSARPHGPFARSLDLFGDGSVTLVSTPGHSLGHMSLIAKTGEHEVFIAGDAIYTMKTLLQGARPWRSEDSRAFGASLAAIQAYAAEHPDAVIVPGHDMGHWETLAPVYG
jgi:glyoxylase-like metal-dependent hydrolase (beta-lactamase superfamily II)